MSASDNDKHYLSAIKLRLEKLYEEHPENAALREHISDECDWIDSQFFDREPSPPDMFVSFVGNRSGQLSYGYVVVSLIEPLTKAEHIEGLARDIEKLRGYEKDTVVISNFKRLES